MDTEKVARELLKIAKGLVAQEEICSEVNRARVAYRFEDLPDDAKKQIMDGKEKAFRVMSQVRSKLNREFPDKKFKKPVIDGERITIWAGDTPEWKVISGVQLSIDPNFEHESGSFSPIVGVKDISSVAYLRFPGQNSEKLQYFMRKIPSVSEIVSLVKSKKMSKNEPGKIDTAVIKKFVDGQRTWFEVDEEDKNSISFSTREHGSVGDEEAGAEDIKEAKRLLKSLRQKFPNLGVSAEVFDEWVYINISNE